jgi:hypothetical protein
LGHRWLCGDVAARRKAMLYPGQPFDLRAYVEKLSPDLGYAILTAAIVEEELERLLLAYLKLDAASLAKCFDDYGPYNSFRGKIRGAYEHYDLIDDDTRNDLLVIKDIRNAFAHTRERLDFNAPALKVLAKKFSGEVDNSDVKRLFDERVSRTITAIQGETDRIMFEGGSELGGAISIP